MTDAWTILKNNSTLDFGDAWQHLQNQNAGTGTVTAETIYIETGGLQGGREYPEKKILVSAKILLNEMRRKIELTAKLIR